MTNARVKIDVAAGVVEIEGDANFVSAYLDRLLPLTELDGFGKRAHRPHASGEHSTVPSQADSQAFNEGGSPEPKKKRRTGKRPPPGSSCRDRIRILRDEGFLKEHRTNDDIVKLLSKEKGWTHSGNQVGAALTNMFNAGEIRRIKAGRSWEYFWDR